MKQQPERTSRAAIVKPAPLAIAAFAAVIAAFAFAPALGAGFQFEDFSYLALMRHIESPWTLTHGSAFFAYYYRATGLLFWWLTVYLVGNDSWSHNLIDLLLHAANAALLALYAMRLTRSRAAGIIAGVVFACLPPAAATAMWMSDRYDPLALLFGLLSLYAFESVRAGSARAALLAGLLLLLALTSKETAYAFAAYMLLRSAWQSWSNRSWAFASTAAIIVPVAAALSLRISTVAIESTQEHHLFVHAMWDGVVAWWQRLPIALFGFRLPSPWKWSLLVVVAVLIALGAAQAMRCVRAGLAQLLLAGALLLLLPPLLQWPVTSLALTHDSAIESVTNLRFYYVSAAGLALIASAAWLALPTRMHVAFTLACALLCMAWLADARHNARKWRDETAATSATLLTAGTHLAAYDFPSRCHIHAQADALPAYLQRRIDLIIKAGARPGASILRCVIDSDTPPFLNLLAATECNSATWPDLPIKQISGNQGIEPHGNVCLIAFSTEQSDRTRGDVFNFYIDANGAVRSAANP